MTQESLIWLKYNVIYEGWRAQLVKAAHVHTQEMMKIMGQTHCSSECYTKLYLCALSSLAEEYAEWKASSQPSIHTTSPPSKSHKSKEEVSLPLKIKVNACKRETPSHQDILPLTTHRDNSVCQVKTTPMEQEVLEPSIHHGMRGNIYFPSCWVFTCDKCHRHIWSIWGLTRTVEWE